MLTPFPLAHAKLCCCPHCTSHEINNTTTKSFFCSLVHPQVDFINCSAPTETTGYGGGLDISGAAVVLRSARFIGCSAWTGGALGIEDFFQGNVVTIQEVGTKLEAVGMPHTHLLSHQAHSMNSYIGMCTWVAQTAVWRPQHSRMHPHNSY